MQNITNENKRSILISNCLLIDEIAMNIREYKVEKKHQYPGRQLVTINYLKIDFQNEIKAVLIVAIRRIVENKMGNKSKIKAQYTY